MNHHLLRQSKRWVIKIGSALITANGTRLDHEAIAHWSAQIAKLRETGKDVVLVSSGSIAEGMRVLGWSQRPHEEHKLQAAAALGQMGLIRTYQEAFSKHQLRTAQVLLTHGDLADRRRYLNARATLRTLVDLKCIPIINENDTVATAEIRFGDNDTLGALVANLVGADVLILLTDQQGLFDDDPRKNPNAKLIKSASIEDKILREVAGPSGSNLGSGGMTTKITAAERAARSGTNTIIASGSEQNILTRLANGEEIGTLICAGQEPLIARKQWLANQLSVCGQLFIDKGAERVLKNNGSSLLAAGVTDVKGEFHRGSLVAIINQNKQEIGRGLCNYPAKECLKLLGKPSSKIETILGYTNEPELIDRDNMVIHQDD